MRRILFTALLAACASAPAQELSKSDALAVRGVVTEQLDAFRRDDGERAFSLATAGIRAKFGSSEVFMEMVRTGYPVVYRPSSVAWSGKRTSKPSRAASGFHELD